MGFRMRRSVRIIPGIKLNFSKSGTSLSLGGRGLTTNIGKKGTRTTVGLPGTGLSYSSYSPRKNQTPNTSAAPKSGASVWIWVVLVVAGFLIFGR